MSDERRRRELGQFLRAHRERLRPEDVGLPESAMSRRRRAPGLRREEVAALAGVGVTWYTWLEQGRVSVSRQVLDSVTRVLQLGDIARKHALTMGGFSWTTRSSSHDQIAADLQPMLDTWRTIPAAALDEHFDVITWNPAYAALWPSAADTLEDKRNLLLMLVADKDIRRSMSGWEPLVKSLVTQLRSHLAEHDSGARGREVLDLLAEQEPQLRHWWECKSVRSFTTQRITWNSKESGDIALTVSCLRPVEHPNALIVLHTPSTEFGQQRIARLLSDSACSNPQAM